MRVRASFCVVVVTALAILTASCSGSQSSGGGSPNPDTKVVRAGSANVAVQTEPFTGLAAGVGIGGTLTMVGRQCVGFRFEDQPVVLVFPVGTAVSGRGSAVVVYAAGADLRIGSRFQAGSLNARAEPLSQFGQLSSQMPAPCRSLGAMAFQANRN